MADKLELWVSISSGLLLITHFAPERLKPGTALGMLLIYIAFSMFMFTNMRDDGRLGEAAVNDARAIAEQHGIASQVLELRNDGEHMRGQTLWARLSILGFFSGTIGYVFLTAWRTWRNTPP